MACHVYPINTKVPMISLLDFQISRLLQFPPSADPRIPHRQKSSPWKGSLCFNFFPQGSLRITRAFSFSLTSEIRFFFFLLSEQPVTLISCKLGKLLREFHSEQSSVIKFGKFRPTGSKSSEFSPRTSRSQIHRTELYEKPDSTHPHQAWRIVSSQTRRYLHFFLNFDRFRHLFPISLWRTHVCWKEFLCMFRVFQSDLQYSPNMRLISQQPKLRLRPDNISDLKFHHIRKLLIFLQMLKDWQCNLPATQDRNPAS
jgi:hypothetical protein